MPIDVTDLAARIRTAFETALGDVGSGDAVARAEADRLAAILAVIETGMVNGALSEDEAGTLIAVQLDAAKAVLKVSPEIPLLSAEKAIQAGRQVIVDTILGAGGLNLLAPLLKSLGGGHGPGGGF